MMLIHPHSLIALFPDIGLSPEQVLTFIENGVDVSIDESKPHYQFKSDGLPDDEISNQFPNRDNPNTVRPQNFNYEIPRNPRPRELDDPGCLPMGPIGIITNLL